MPQVVLKYLPCVIVYFNKKNVTKEVKPIRHSYKKIIKIQRAHRFYICYNKSFDVGSFGSFLLDVDDENSSEHIHQSFRQSLCVLCVSN